MTRFIWSFDGLKFSESEPLQFHYGERLTLVTFASEAAHERWRTDAVHRAAQQRGREEFYNAYDITVAGATRRHTWQRA